jgi:hypothetical protein
MKLQGFAVAGKSWVALIGSLLAFIVPWVVQVSVGLPAPWPALVGAVVALLTAFGVYQAPYRPVTPNAKTATPASTPWPTA